MFPSRLEEELVKDHHGTHWQEHPRQLQSISLKKKIEKIFINVLFTNEKKQTQQHTVGVINSKPLTQVPVREGIIIHIIIISITVPLEKNNVVHLKKK